MREDDDRWQSIEREMLLLKSQNSRKLPNGRKAGERRVKRAKIREEERQGLGAGVVGSVGFSPASDKS